MKSKLKILTTSFLVLFLSSFCSGKSIGNNSLLSLLGLKKTEVIPVVKAKGSFSNGSITVYSSIKFDTKFSAGDIAVTKVNLAHFKHKGAKLAGNASLSVFLKKTNGMNQTADIFIISTYADDKVTINSGLSNQKFSVTFKKGAFASVSGKTIKDAATTELTYSSDGVIQAGVSKYNITSTIGASKSQPTLKYPVQKL